MTMTRVSMVFAAEGYVDNEKTGKDDDNTVSNFGKGRGWYKKKRLKASAADADADAYESVRCPWIHAPTGTFIGNDHNRQAAPIRAMGTKKWDTVQYGAFTGSFNWTFTLDYNYLQPLFFFFEGYKMDKTTTPGMITYHFKKEDYSRVKSFTVIRTILNSMTGGGKDEAEQFLGCVAKNVTISRSAGTSTINVTVTGFYVAERMFLGELTATDYQTNDGQLAEYMCMFVAEEETTDITKMNYVANTESVTIGIDNNADKIYNTCSPFATAYYEGLTDYKFTTSCYANNPLNYKQRLYGGGELVNKTGNNFVIVPRVKKLKPLKRVLLLTYDGSATTAENINNLTEADIQKAYNESPRRFKIVVDDMVIKSLNWSKSEGQKMTDNISSAECKNIEIEFQTYTDANLGHLDLCIDPPTNDMPVKNVCDIPVVNAKDPTLDW